VQTCPRPDVVEWHDVTSRDPKLLVYLKSLRNTVPVPRHWCFKRKYLAGKRGVERAPFQLPDFIRRTGIQVNFTTLEMIFLRFELLAFNCGNMNLLKSLVCLFL
jgi:hypothetical protein